MKNFVAAIAFLLSVIALGWHLYDLETRTEIVYVNVSEVFDEFTMTKEMEKRYEETSSVRQHILDSLKFSFNQMLKEAEVNSAEMLRREISYREQQFKESNQMLIEKSNEEILKQLNVYMKEFGESSGYDFVLGAQGNGSLIYAKTQKDVTRDMIEFVNARYQGIQ